MTIWQWPLSVFYAVPRTWLSSGGHRCQHFRCDLAFSRTPNRKTLGVAYSCYRNISCCRLLLVLDFFAAAAAAAAATATTTVARFICSASLLGTTSPLGAESTPLFFRFLVYLCTPAISAMATFAAASFALASLLAAQIWHSTTIDLRLAATTVAPLDTCCDHYPVLATDPTFSRIGSKI